MVRRIYVDGDLGSGEFEDPERGHQRVFTPIRKGVRERRADLLGRKTKNLSHGMDMCLSQTRMWH